MPSAPRFVFLGASAVLEGSFNLRVPPRVPVALLVLVGFFVALRKAHCDVERAFFGGFRDEGFDILGMTGFVREGIGSLRKPETLRLKCETVETSSPQPYPELRKSVEPLACYSCWAILVPFFTSGVRWTLEAEGPWGLKTEALSLADRGQGRTHRSLRSDRRSRGGEHGQRSPGPGMWRIRVTTYRTYVHPKTYPNPRREARNPKTQTRNSK